MQQSSSKLNEERIFELKQRIEDVLMENDTLNEEGQRLKREFKSLRYVICTCIWFNITITVVRNVVGTV